VPDASDLRPGAVGRLIRATVLHRLWLGGIAADTVGLALQIVALHLGPLAAVQPLLILSLLFALLLGQRHHGRLHLAETAWVLLVIGALIGLLALAGTAGRTTSVVDRGPAISAGVAAVVLAAGCVLLGRRNRGANGTAALLGVAVGVIYAVTAALLKATTDIAVRHPVAILWSWQFYLVIGLGAAGLLLNQLAFQAGPLAMSLPAMSTVDPLLSIAIGVWVFDERIRHGALTDFGLAALLLVLGVGVIQLARASANLTPTGGPPALVRPD
jgi:drug/metabolite transporter (DMT)-like permease